MESNTHTDKLAIEKALAVSKAIKWGKASAGQQTEEEETGRLTEYTSSFSSPTGMKKHFWAW